MALQKIVYKGQILDSTIVSCEQPIPSVGDTITVLESTYIITRRHWDQITADSYVVSLHCDNHADWNDIE